MENARIFLCKDGSNRGAYLRVEKQWLETVSGHEVVGVASDPIVLVRTLLRMDPSRYPQIGIVGRLHYWDHEDEQAQMAVHGFKAVVRGILVISYGARFIPGADTHLDNKESPEALLDAIRQI